MLLANSGALRVSMSSMFESVFIVTSLVSLVNWKIIIIKAVEMIRKFIFIKMSAAR